MSESFSLFTRRQRRRWPLWLLLATVAIGLSALSLNLADGPADDAADAADPPAPTVTEALAGPGGAVAPPPAAAPSDTAAAPAMPPAASPAAVSATEAAPDPAPEIRALVETWRSAWSGKDATAYLATYADDFAPPDGVSLATWQAQRRERLGTPRQITVVVDRLEVEADGDRATARFLQHYRSGRLDEKVIKRLALRRTPGGWKIAQEVVETPPR
jgi:ketosteroid isomerase-like protein